MPMRHRFCRSSVLVLVLVLALSSCGGPPALTACFGLCDKLSACFSVVDLHACRASCAAQPRDCVENTDIAFVVDECAQSQCDQATACTLTLGLRFPQCNPN